LFPFETRRFTHASQSAADRSERIVSKKQGLKGLKGLKGRIQFGHSVKVSFGRASHPPKFRTPTIVAAIEHFAGKQLMTGFVHVDAVFGQNVLGGVVVH
jgi:hypothetical protein